MSQEIGHAMNDDLPKRKIPMPDTAVLMVVIPLMTVGFGIFLIDPPIVCRVGEMALVLSSTLVVSWIGHVIWQIRQAARATHHPARHNAAQEAERSAQLSQELWRSEMRFRRLVEQSPDTIIIVYAATGNIAYTNDDTLVGHRLQAGDDFLNLVQRIAAPESREAILIQWQTLVDPDRLVVPYEEWQVLRPDGHSEWLQSRAAVLSADTNEQPAELLFTFSIITEQKLSEQAVRASEEQLRLIFDESLDVVMIIDVDERIQRVNAAVEPILGYTPDELLNEQFSRLLPAGEGISHEDLHNYNIIYDALPFLRKDGSLCHMELTATIVAWGGTESIYITLRDVTTREELRAEVEQNRRMQEAFARDREIMKARENILFVVAHQLRNPLAVIHASASIVQTYHDRLTPQRRSDHLNRIMTQIRYLDRMTENMLTAREAMLGQLAFIPKRCAIAEVCYAVFDGLAQTVDPGKHTLRFENTSQTVWALLDETLLIYIVENLLSNAIKYSPNGGEIRLSLTEADEQYIIAVSDQGIGIPEAARDKLFELFFRAENTEGFRGTGIGLGLAHSSVLAHGGTLTFESVEGQGATFYAYLPIVQPTD